MTSKEIIKNHIESLKEQAQIEIEQETGSEIYCQIEIEQYEKVLKDLEDYEELLKIMGTPIQQIMKNLEILEILKPYINLDEMYEEDAKKVMRWLRNEKNNR